MTPQIETFFDPVTGTISYVVYDQSGGSAAVIDPVLDYDPKSARTSTGSADRVVQFLDRHNLTLEWILETHVHADHLSAAHYLKENRGGRIGIGEHVKTVQRLFQPLFGAHPVSFDHLFSDQEVFSIGALQGRVLFVPGHTPADVAYQLGDCVFVGDTLFMPDVGSARCDFPGGDAKVLYQSAQRLLDLPDETRLFMCHDYPPADRRPAWVCTVAQARQHNIHLAAETTESAFVALRKARDATLDAPVLLLPSIQVNLRAGELPQPESNGIRYLKIPLNAV